MALLNRVVTIQVSCVLFTANPASLVTVESVEEQREEQVASSRQLATGLDLKAVAASRIDLVVCHRDDEPGKLTRASCLAS